MKSNEGDPLSPAFFWPVLAAEAASEFASAMTRGLTLAPDMPAEPPVTPPRWTTHNTIALELTAMRLRNFSQGRAGAPALICAPFALHGATIVDFAPRHSLAAALLDAGVASLFVTDWRSATSEMRYWNIDDYLAELNVAVDEIGGPVDLVGLCQGGWMALVYAARFPAKVRKLVLAGAPIDIAAGQSKLSKLANNTPTAFFRELVELGEGRVLGQHLLQLWAPPIERDEIQRILGETDAFGTTPPRLEQRFRDWYAWTVDLPGKYYLQVVEELFRANQLARKEFVALGRRIDFADLHCPVFLLAAKDDEIVAVDQLFAAEPLLTGAHGKVTKEIVPGIHLSLFMGKTTLSSAWPAVGRWLQQGD
jgi:poly(3-hydroxybutyrate) depolymerase